MVRILSVTKLEGRLFGRNEPSNAARVSHFDKGVVNYSYLQHLQSGSMEFVVCPGDSSPFIPISVLVADHMTSNSSSTPNANYGRIYSEKDAF